MKVYVGNVCEPCSRAYQVAIDSTNLGPEYQPLILVYSVPKETASDTGWVAEADCDDCHGDVAIQNQARPNELNAGLEPLPYPVTGPGIKDE